MKSKFLIVALVLSFCSFVYELLLANSLAIVSGSYIWWHSFTIAFYLGGLGLGAYRYSTIKNRYQALIRVEFLLAFLGSLVAVFVYTISSIYEVMDYIFFLNSDFYSTVYLENHFFLKFIFFCLAQSFTLIIGFLSGFELPILIDLHGKSINSEQDENKVLAYNYLGTLLGTLLFAFFLLPRLDIIYSSALVGLLNFCVAIYLWKELKVKDHVLKLLAPLAFLSCVLVFINANKIEQMYLKILYRHQASVTRSHLDMGDFFERIERGGEITRMKSIYQYIDFFKAKVAKRNELTDILTLNTNFQFATHAEGKYHEGFAHFPRLVTEFNPKNVLVLGAGDGLLIRDLLKVTSIQSITHIELDAKMVELANHHPVISKMNEKSLQNPKVNTIIEDAFFYLRNTKEVFDAVYMDFPYPNNFNLSKLYSVEFYRYVKRSLAPNGYVVFDAPLAKKNYYDHDKFRGRIIVGSVFGLKDKRKNSKIMSTAYYAGFEKLYPYAVGNESFLIMTNRKEPLLFKLEVPREEESDLYRSIAEKEFSALGNQHFPHELNKKYVNSIFRPTLLDRDD